MNKQSLKTFAFFLVFALVLTGCNQKKSEDTRKEAINLVKKATTAYENETSFHITLSADVKVKSGVIEMPIQMNIDYQMNKLEGGQVEGIMNLSISAKSSNTPVNMDMTLYNKDGNNYVEAFGMKQRAEGIYDTESLLNQFDFTTDYEEWISKASIKDVKTDKEVTMTMNQKKLNEINPSMNKFLSQLLSTEDVKLEFTEPVVLVYRIDKDNKLKSLKQEMVVNMKISNQSANMNMTMKLEILNTDHQDLVFPDFSEFLEANAVTE